MSTEATEAARKYGAIACSEIARIRYANERRDYPNQRQYAHGLEDGYGHALFEHAAPLEDEVAKLRALVQVLRGKLDTAVRHGGSAVLLLNDDRATRQWKKVLKELRQGLTKEEGFTPTNTEDK